MSYPYGGPGRDLPPAAFGRPEAPPAGATAIVAAALSLIFGSVLALGTFSASMYAFGDLDPQYRSGEVIRSVVGCGIGAFLWLLGATLLFLRTTAGRLLVIIASALSLIFAISQVVHVRDKLDLMAFALVIALAPLVTLVLAAVPATGRWIVAKPRRY